MQRILFFALTITLSISGCGTTRTSSEPLPGPDRQFDGTVHGALTGAGAGAVTGFQVGAGTGPGALVGAGLGAVAGGIQGAVQDGFDQNLIRLSEEADMEREKLHAQEILHDQFKRRIELHPTREIYPADLFFAGDQAKVRRDAKVLVAELARLNRNRVPWSKLVITAYVKSKSKESEFATYLAQERSKDLVNHFVRAGIEPRRLEARAVIIEQPILMDPMDQPGRYNQAIEIIPLDR